MKNERLFHQLVSKDGMRSELMPLRSFMPEIHTELRRPLAYGMMTTESAMLPDSPITSRRYRFRRSYEVTVIEYEEID